MTQTQKKKTILSWSSGKDSAWTLLQLLNNPEIELVGLMTSVNQKFERVAMHAVRVELLKQQALHAKYQEKPLELNIIELPFPCSNEDYQQIMSKNCDKLISQGIEQIAFGDLFLEDVRNYRVDRLKNTGLTPIFPLWQTNTQELAEQMVASSLKAIVTCVDPKKLPKSFCGRHYDESFLKDIQNLPKDYEASIDPCGENGEFHTFVYDGDMFSSPISVKVGEVVERDGFVFADVLMA